MIFKSLQGLPGVLGTGLGYSISDSVFRSDEDRGRRTAEAFPLDGFVLDTGFADVVLTISIFRMTIIRRAKRRRYTSRSSVLRGASAAGGFFDQGRKPGPLLLLVRQNIAVECGIVVVGCGIVTLCGAAVSFRGKKYTDGFAIICIQSAACGVRLWTDVCFTVGVDLGASIPSRKPNGWIFLTAGFVGRVNGAVHIAVHDVVARTLVVAIIVIAIDSDSVQVVFQDMTHVVMIARDIAVALEVVDMVANCIILASISPIYTEPATGITPLPREEKQCIRNRAGHDGIMTIVERVVVVVDSVVAGDIVISAASPAAMSPIQVQDTSQKTMIAEISVVINGRISYDIVAAWHSGIISHDGMVIETIIASSMGINLSTGRNMHKRVVAVAVIAADGSTMNISGGIGS